MSNIIDNILLSESTPTSNVNNVAEQSSKDKPSLFDSLLSNISSSEDIQLKEDISSNTQIKSVDIKDTKLETNNLTNSVESLENVENIESLDNLTTVTPEIVESKEQKITTGSLLDKLVIEAKKSAMTEQSNKDKVSLFDSLVSNVSSGTEINQTIEESLSTEVEIKQPSVVNSKIVSDATNNNESKVENLENIDLSTELEVVVSSKEENAEKELKNNLLSKSNKLNEQNSKVSLENILTEDVTTDIKNVNANISTQNQEVSINQINNTNIEVKIPTESLTQQEDIIEPTTSLLDKLVVNAKKNIKEAANNTILDTNKLSTVEKTLLPEDVQLEEQAISLDKNIVVDNIEIENLEQTNVNLVNEKVLNSTDKVLKPTEKISDEITKIEKEKINNLDIKLTNKIDNLESNLTIVNNTTTEKTVNETNNLLVQKSNNEVLETPSTVINTLDEEATLVIDDKVEIKDENKLESKSQVIKNEKLSLMDQLIQKSSENLALEDSLNNNIMDSSTKEIITKDLISSIYLGSQKNKINNQTLFNKNEAVSILKEGNSVQAIKTSAEILDLGLENISIDESIDTNELEIDKLDLKELNKKGILENLLLQKNVKSEEVKNIITTSIEASKALIEDTITIADDTIVNVNSPIAYNIQSKIIGAKQQMATMMSDISRQMYENYKPPVTAFKINLNPIELGSIAILMKSDKNSGLSITMNVSNNVTLDTLIENQNVLKNSLNKTFDENTKFNLDFGSSNQNSNNQSSNSNQNQSNRQFEQQMDTQSILQLKEENKDIEEKVIDYM